MIERTDLLCPFYHTFDRYFFQVGFNWILLNSKSDSFAYLSFDTRNRPFSVCIEQTWKDLSKLRRCTCALCFWGPQIQEIFFSNDIAFFSSRHTTLKQRRPNVDSTPWAVNQHWIDIVSTLWVCWVVAVLIFLLSSLQYLSASQLSEK